MAQVIIGDKKKPVSEPLVYDPGYRHSIVQSKDIPQTGLLTMASGAPILLEYYRAALGADEEPQAFQPESVGTYRSYIRINNLIGKRDGTKNFSFNPEKGTSEDRYTIYLMIDAAPNIGDLAILDIGAGRAGLLTIYEQPELLTTDVEKCYRCEFVLSAIVTKELFDTLNARVIKELYYNKDNVLAGGNAVLTEDDMKDNQRLYSYLPLIVEEIYNSFFFEDEDTILVPTDDNTYLYDPFLTEFLLYTIPNKYIGNNRRITLMNVNYHADGKSSRNNRTVWDMLKSGDFDNPKRYDNTYYTHSRESMLNTRYYGNVFFSKIDRVINTTKQSASHLAYTNAGTVFPIVPGTSVEADCEGQPYDYFFSKEFYEGKGTETEQFIWKMFKDKTIDKKGLLEVLDKFWDLPPRDRLYMSGIYLLAIKRALIASNNYF